MIVVRIIIIIELHWGVDGGRGQFHNSQLKEKLLTSMEARSTRAACMRVPSLVVSTRCAVLCILFLLLCLPWLCIEHDAV